MNNERLKNFEDIVNVSNVIFSYETVIKAWHDRLRAVQKLRRLYKDSPFVQKDLKQEEKVFKAKWWKALNELKKFKHEMGLE